MKKIIYLLSLLTMLLTSFINLKADEFDELDTSEGSSSALGVSFEGSITLEQGANITNTGPRQQGTSDEDWTLANRRFRLKTSKDFDETSFYSKLDFNYNELDQTQEIDIREMRIKFSPLTWMDISAGRQVSTWGVGDMLYINDLFPKNWVSNFQGRENEMLKDPSNSLRVTTYLTDEISWDLVYHPKFAADTTPNGQYFTVYDPNTLSLIDKSSTFNTSSEEDNQLSSSEIASQFKWNLFDQEMAMYFYNGFYKNPKSLRKVGQLYMPLYSRLNVYGLSSEGQVGKGILSFETGYNHSRDDKSRSDPLIENSSMKYLLGYKLDLTSSFSVGLQYFVEQMMNYQNYTKNLVGDAYKYRRSEFSSTYTLRMTYKAMQETLWFNLFTYIRPESHDSYTKIDIDKVINDNLKVSTGVNIFTGSENYKSSEFGMLKNDDNVYLRLRLDF